MGTIINKNKYLFLIYVSILTFLLIYIDREGKVDSFLAVRAFHNPFYDSLFRIITFFGDGIFMLLVGIFYLLFIRILDGLIIISSFLISGLFVQTLKKLLFIESLRPVLYFNNMGVEIHKIPGMDYHSYFSFPSGHSATAFALFLGLAFFARNQFVKIFFLIFACIISFSRVYLAQHFLEDIIAGSLIGTIIILFVYYFFSGKNIPWAEKRLIKIKSSKNE